MSNELEQSFAQLAYSHLQDNLPELYPHLIGFQLIDSDESKKRNLGMFAYNINGEYFYMPVFFINGFIKPLVHLFNMKTKKFTAATPNNIRIMLQPKAEPGIELNDKEKHKKLYSNPNISNFTISPVLSKIGSFNRPMFGTVVDVITSLPFKEPIENRFTARLKTAAPLVKKAFAKGLIQDRELFRKVATEYPGIVDLIKQADTAEPYGYREQIEEPEIIIEDEPRPELGMAVNEDIYNKGYSVKDTRGETSTVTPIQNYCTEPYGGTDKNGMYRVITCCGHEKDYLILRNPQEFTDKGKRPESMSEKEIDSDSKDLVIDLESGECKIACHSEILARHIHSQNGEENYWKKIWDKTIDLTKCKVGKTYVLILPEAERRFSGSCTTPFTISKKLLNNNNLYTFYVEPHMDRLTVNNKITVQPRGTNSIVVIDNYEYHKEHDPCGEMLVTPDARLMEVEIKYPCNIMLGNFHDLMAGLYNKGIHKIEIDNVPYVKHAYKIRQGDMVKEAGFVPALRHLMVDHGMNESDALICLKEKGSYLVKKAFSVQTYDEPYYEVNSNILPSDQEKEYDTVKLNDLIPDSSRQRKNSKENLGTLIRGKMTPEMDIYLAQLAAQNGDTDVLDTSMLATLSKHKNNLEEVKQDIPVFMQAVHRLGMLLFRLWWHLDDFKEMFTTDELYDLEQNALELFKNLNDLAMTLKFNTRLGFVDV